MKSNRLYALVCLLAACLCALPFRAQLQRVAAAALQSLKGKRTVEDRVAQYGERVKARLAPAFARANTVYPPVRVTLVGLKAERVLQVWVAGEDGQSKHLKDYPILGLSGALGPKLREGDYQVPEGLYRVESLNPNSLYHLALRVNYPNADDRRRGQQDGRTRLGSDIMIHGNKGSVGCLAMGDEAAEDLFVLAAEAGIGNVLVILSPIDFRTRGLPLSMPTLPSWIRERYDTIQAELKKLE